jgi:hypothetical protein
LALKKGSMGTNGMAEKDSGDPIQTDAFQRVIRHFVTTPPKPHEQMKLGKSKGKTGAKASRKPKPEK